MKKSLLLSALLAAAAAGCVSLGLVASPGVENKTVKGEGIEIRYKWNYLLETIPGLGETPACVRTFFKIPVDVRNTGTAPLILRQSDFLLAIDGALEMKPMLIADYCQEFFIPKCAPAVRRLEELKKKDPQSWAQAVATKNQRVAECIKNNHPPLFTEQGLIVEPGKALTDVSLTFYSPEFHKRYFFEHSFAVRYHDLPPFVLADEDFWEQQNTAEPEPAPVPSTPTPATPAPAPGH